MNLSRQILMLSFLLTLLGCKRNGSEETANSNKVVFSDSGGRTLTIADLRDASTTVAWEIHETNQIPREAQKLHKQAREAGGRGDYTNALVLLKDAAQIAPAWPYPVYDTAFTLLLMGDSEGALGTYRKVDQMASNGFFTTKTAIWSLTGERDGIFSKGTYRAYLQIEWARTSDEKRQIVEEILKRSPSFAPAWKESALLQELPEKRLTDLQKGLSLDPDPETMGMLSVNKAATLNSLGKRDEAVRLLGELVVNPKSTTATKALAKSTLALLLDVK